MQRPSVVRLTATVFAVMCVIAPAAIAGTRSRIESSVLAPLHAPVKAGAPIQISHLPLVEEDESIVLEAHRVIRNNNEQWMHSLSGVCRREDIGPNNIVLSKDIANPQVKKEEMGQIRDAYKRGWLIRWWDQFGPF